MSNFRQTGRGRECGPILNPQYQHESVEGNVVLEFNVSRFIPKIIIPRLEDKSGEIEVALKLNKSKGWVIWRNCQV